MSPSAVIPLRQHAIRSIIPNVFNSPSRRHQSTSQLELLSRELMNRMTHHKHERIDPRLSYGLSKILSTYLPVSCQVLRPPTVGTRKDPRSYLPQGHHQVFFNDLHPESFLLPDGTDKAHYAGPPFEQRLWAGGSLTFNSERRCMMMYDTMSILQENIEEVKVKGIEGQEKVFVTISRKIGLPSLVKPRNPRLPLPNFRTLPGVDLENRNLGPLAMEEKKTLVFLRAKTEEERRQSLENVLRIIKPIHEPDFRITITPTPHLLSRFSAMTNNAHRIHLDRHYCREVEGHRNLLVHGPLLQVLMLSVLRSQLTHTAGELITRFDYKNLAPLYADEPMHICVRRHPDNSSKFDVWIEGPEGGYAVKATAEVGFALEWSTFSSNTNLDRNGLDQRLENYYKVDPELYSELPIGQEKLERQAEIHEAGPVITKIPYDTGAKRIKLTPSKAPAPKEATEQFSDLISVLKEQSPSRNTRKATDNTAPLGWEELHGKEWGSKW